MVLLCVSTSPKPNVCLCRFALMLRCQRRCMCRLRIERMFMGCVGVCEWTRVWLFACQSNSHRAFGCKIYAVCSHAKVDFSLRYTVYANGLDFWSEREKKKVCDQRDPCEKHEHFAIAQYRKWQWNIYKPKMPHMFVFSKTFLFKKCKCSNQMSLCPDQFLS